MLYIGTTQPTRNQRHALRISALSAQPNAQIGPGRDTLIIRSAGIAPTPICVRTTLFALSQTPRATVCVDFGSPLLHALNRGTSRRTA